MSVYNEWAYHLTTASGWQLKGKSYENEKSCVRMGNDVSIIVL